MPDLEQATPDDGSLESASTRLEGLLSQAEEKEKIENEPEQAKPKLKAESKQAQPEQEEETPKIEDAKSQDERKPDEAQNQPRAWKVKVAGQDVEVTEEELLKGYSRTEDYTRKTQELAKSRREFEEREVAQVRAEREQLQKLLEDFKPIVRPTEPKWEELKAQLAPEQYAERLEQWRVQQNHLQTIEKTQAEIRARQDADAQRGFEQYVKDEQARLEIELPAFKEPEKAKVLKKELSDFAITRGFTEEDLSRVTDHRLVLLLHDAMVGAKAKAKAPEIKNKIERALESSAPGSRTTAQKVDKAQAAKERLRKSGSIHDGAAVLTALLED
jgi:hypothetical protein